MSTTQTDDLTTELQHIINEKKRERHYLHYVNRDRPFSRALCGTRAPRRGWWADKETEAEAAVDSWEICPACQVKYSALPAGGPGHE